MMFGCMNAQPDLNSDARSGCLVGWMQVGFVTSCMEW
jgi:hypothetical protein